MKHQHHFGSANVIPLREVARIGAYIGDLKRRAQLLDYDIAAEEERAGAAPSSTPARYRNRPIVV
jgi:hypothetical protein